MSVNSSEPLCSQIVEQGFALITGIFSLLQTEYLRAELEQALTGQRDEAIRSTAGNIYAARNVLSLYPPAATIWWQPVLVAVLRSVLGERFGLVRALFFDKPPERTWALPWHKDLTIAVRDNTLPSSIFSKPTHKSEVPHVEAPLSVLQNMLTARIHLDEVTPENGPLRVIPGSHHSGKSLELGQQTPQTILTDAGGVLLMRPLLAHSSGLSHPETRRHRRILHLEFASSPELPDGFQWHDFRAGS